MTATIPGLEDARDAWEAADAELNFWRDHYADLVQQYPDQFVAVRDGTVVARNPDLLQVVQSLKHQGIDPTRVWLRFLTTDPRRLMP